MFKQKFNIEDNVILKGYYHHGKIYCVSFHDGEITYHIKTRYCDIDAKENELEFYKPERNDNMFKYEIGQDVFATVLGNKINGKIHTRYLIEKEKSHSIKYDIKLDKNNKIIYNIYEDAISLRTNYCFDPDFKFNVGDVIMSPSGHCFKIINGYIITKKDKDGFKVSKSYDIKRISTAVDIVMTNRTEDDISHWEYVKI